MTFWVNGGITAVSNVIRSNNYYDKYKVHRCLLGDVYEEDVAIRSKRT